MAKAPILDGVHLEKICKLLGEYTKGHKITDALVSLKLDHDLGGENGTKWRRLYATFDHYQQQDGAASKLIDYICTTFNPFCFVECPAEFEEKRRELNILFAFAGLKYGKDGKFYRVEAAKTIDEAHERAETLRVKLRGRIIHDEVSKYCKSELLEENYFHAVFEASKGLAQRIREKSGADGDGAALIDKVFSVSKPLLAFNTLETETEQSEHKGFASLLKGCFAAVRNPLAHEPKILWEGEDDAADYLSLISLLHRKLDNCAKTRLEL